MVSEKVNISNVDDAVHVAAALLPVYAGKYNVTNRQAKKILYNKLLESAKTMLGNGLNRSTTREFIQKHIESAHTAGSFDLGSITEKLLATLKNTFPYKKFNGTLKGEISEFLISLRADDPESAQKHYEKLKRNLGERGLHIIVSSVDDELGRVCVNNIRQVQMQISKPTFPDKDKLNGKIISFIKSLKPYVSVGIDRYLSVEQIENKISEIEKEMGDQETSDLKKDNLRKEKETLLHAKENLEVFLEGSHIKKVVEDIYDRVKSGEQVKDTDKILNEILPQQLGVFLEHNKFYKDRILSRIYAEFMESLGQQRENQSKNPPLALDRVKKPAPMAPRSQKQEDTQIKEQAQNLAQEQGVNGEEVHRISEIKRVLFEAIDEGKADEYFRGNWHKSERGKKFYKMAINTVAKALIYNQTGDVFRRFCNQAEEEADTYKYKKLALKTVFNRVVAAFESLEMTLRDAEESTDSHEDSTEDTDKKKLDKSFWLSGASGLVMGLAALAAAWTFYLSKENITFNESGSIITNSSHTPVEQPKQKDTGKQTERREPTRQITRHRAAQPEAKIGWQSRSLHKDKLHIGEESKTQEQKGNGVESNDFGRIVPMRGDNLIRILTNHFQIPWKLESLNFTRKEITQSMFIFWRTLQDLQQAGEINLHKYGFSDSVHKIKEGRELSLADLINTEITIKNTQVRVIDYIFSTENAKRLKLNSILDNDVLKAAKAVFTFSITKST